MQRTTLLCTVGTSLLNNLRRPAEDHADGPSNREALHRACERKAWKTLAGELLNVAPSHRVCGAEINTIEEVRKKKWLSLERLVFLVSDTEAGKTTGRLLCDYFARRDDMKLHRTEYQVIEALQDERPKDFKGAGLRNLVRRMGECIRAAGGPEHAAIDATGGYKAQIAIGVLLGQVLNIPVFYKHERFSEIIDFPPLPISFDYRLLGRHADLLAEFERGGVFSSHDIPDFDEKLRVLLTEVTEQDESLYELGPLGQLYLTGFRLLHPAPVRPAKAEDRKPPAFQKHHYPKGFTAFVERVWRENEWIRTARALPYDRQSSIRRTGFKVVGEASSCRLIGDFQDEDHFGGRFELVVPGASFEALTWAADHLNRKYKG